MPVPVVWRERAGAPMLQVQLPVHDPFTLFQLGIFKSNKAGGWGSGGCGPQLAASLSMTLLQRSTAWTLVALVQMQRREARCLGLGCRVSQRPCSPSLPCLCLMET